jgi:hypothetical protein
LTKTRSGAQNQIKLGAIVDFKDMPLRERDGCVLASSQWSSGERDVRAGSLLDDLQTEVDYSHTSKAPVVVWTAQHDSGEIGALEIIEQNKVKTILSLS